MERSICSPGFTRTASIVSLLKTQQVSWTQLRKSLKLPLYSIDYFMMLLTSNVTVPGAIANKVPLKLYSVSLLLLEYSLFPCWQCLLFKQCSVPETDSMSMSTFCNYSHVQVPLNGTGIQPASLETGRTTVNLFQSCFKSKYKSKEPGL